MTMQNEPIRWEYKSIEFNTSGWLSLNYDPSTVDAKLNQLGKDGWELVSTTGLNEHYGRTIRLVVFLRRPRSDGNMA
jgi:hypothetical protein